VSKRARILEIVKKFLEEAEEKGYTVYFVGPAGSIPAMAISLCLWKIFEPFRHLIHYIRACSGACLIMVPAAIGITSLVIEKIFRALRHLRNVVENIGFFAEYNQGTNLRGKLKDLWSYFTYGWFKATMTFWRHMADHRVGIVQGEHIKNLLRKIVKNATFKDAKPTLEIVATKDGSAEPYIFSEETTPNVTLWDATVASCAIEHLFAIQKIDDDYFVDAAAVETVPIESVIKSHIARGLDPKKLLIIGAVVHTLEKSDVFHAFTRQKSNSSTTQKRNFELEKDLAINRYGTKLLMLEFDANKVILPPAEPFAEFEELGKGFRFLRKLIAMIFNREAHDKFLRGIGIHLYKEINPAHFKLYLDHFEKIVDDKLERHIKEIKL